MILIVTNSKRLDRDIVFNSRSFFVIIINLCIIIYLFHINLPLSVPQNDSEGEEVAHLPIDNARSTEDASSPTPRVIIPFHSRTRATIILLHKTSRYPIPKGIVQPFLKAALKSPQEESGHRPIIPKCVAVTPAKLSEGELYISCWFQSAPIPRHCGPAEFCKVHWTRGFLVYLSTEGEGVFGCGWRTKEIPCYPFPQTELAGICI